MDLRGSSSAPMAPLKAAHLSTPAAAGSLAGCADAKQAVICLFAEAHASKDTAPGVPAASHYTRHAC